MQNPVEPTTRSDQCDVRFLPPLAEQRQGFLLDVLRRHPATSVLDIGCGEGSLLSAICRPSISLPPSPDFDERYGIRQNAPIKSPQDLYPSLNVNRVAGMDIVEEVLRAADEGVQPPDTSIEYNRYSAPRPRFTSLNVKLWKGGLQYFNNEFQNYDIIFSTEVIEHLPYDILPNFCPMILGRYAPDILAITTPNFDFNKLFTPPESPPFIHPSASPGHRTGSGGILDPTGITNRVFRHPDHKFEWTRTEFHDWCTSNAKIWGYQVEISGVGKSVNKDPWNRDERDESDSGTLFASQTAIFRRILDDKKAHIERYAEAATTTIEAKSVHQSTNPSGATIHELLFDYDHDPHPSLKSSPAEISFEMILEAIRDVMTNDIGCGELNIDDIWNNDVVPILCRGRLEALYDALRAAGIEDTADGEEKEWEWIDPENRARWARRVRWRKYAPKEFNALEARDPDSSSLEQADDSMRISEDEEEPESTEDVHNNAWPDEGKTDTWEEWGAGEWRENIGESETRDPGTWASGGWGQDVDQDLSGWGDLAAERSIAKNTQ